MKTIAGHLLVSAGAAVLGVYLPWPAPLGIVLILVGYLLWDAGRTDYLENLGK